MEGGSLKGVFCFVETNFHVDVVAEDLRRCSDGFM